MRVILSRRARGAWRLRFTRLRSVCGRGTLEQDRCIEALYALAPRVRHWQRFLSRQAQGRDELEINLSGDLSQVQWLARVLIWHVRRRLVRVSIGHSPAVSVLRVTYRVPLLEQTSRAAARARDWAGPDPNTEGLSTLVRLAAEANTLREWRQLSRRGIGPRGRIRRSSLGDLDHQPLQRRQLAGAA